MRDVLVKPLLPGRLRDALQQALGVGPAVPPSAALWGDPAETYRAALTGLRVLLVEDNPINQELATALLEEVGVIVTVADEGRSALAMMEVGAFDAVLMDVQMPVMDGYEATRAIRDQPRWRGLPVIAMTANAMSGDRDKALEAGMNDHIAKPLSVAAMYETLARWARPAKAAVLP
jgi:CheY-like chemotaxis protein